MRFASVVRDGKPAAVAIDDELAIPLTQIAQLGALTPTEVLRDPPLDRAAAFPLAEASLRPVVPAPGKVICVGLNYRAHIEETQREESDYPVLFTKFATSLTGPFDPIPCPRSPRRSTTRASSRSSSATGPAGSPPTAPWSTSPATPWPTT